jgi:hypothetical protein
MGFGSRHNSTALRNEQRKHERVGAMGFGGLAPMSDVRVSKNQDSRVRKT